MGPTGLPGSTGPTGTLDLSGTVDGDLHVTGKLTLDGDLDPPNIILSGPTPSIRTTGNAPLSVQAAESVFSGNTRVTGSLIVDGVGGTSAIQAVLLSTPIVVGQGQTAEIYSVDMTRAGTAIVQVTAPVTLIPLSPDPVISFLLQNSTTNIATTAKFGPFPNLDVDNIHSISFTLFVAVGGVGDFIEVQCINDGPGSVIIGDNSAHNPNRGIFITVTVV